MKNLMSLVVFLVSGSALASGITNIQQVGADAELTAVLTDTFHRTLYVFDPDQSAGKPSCNARCAEVWPPLTVTDAEASRLGNADLGVQKRDSNLQQVTYKGRPVYLFNLDRLPGDVKGDGIGGVWHIVPIH